MKKEEQKESDGGSSGSMVEEVKEEEKPSLEIELKPYRIIPWLLPKRDGRHEIVLTRLPFDAYCFTAMDEVIIYLKSVETKVDEIDTVLVGTFPDLNISPHDKNKIIKTPRPISLAIISNEEVRAVAQNLELPEITREILSKSIDAMEGYRSLELQYMVEFLKNELASKDRVLKRQPEDSEKMSEERFWHLMEARGKAFQATRTKVSSVEKVRNVFDNKKFKIIVGMLFILAVMIWLGWFF